MQTHRPHGRTLPRRIRLDLRIAGYCRRALGLLDALTLEYQVY